MYKDWDDMIWGPTFISVLEIQQIKGYDNFFVDNRWSLEGGWNSGIPMWIVLERLYGVR